jgi:hypothetical protein
MSKPRPRGAEAGPVLSAPAPALTTLGPFSTAWRVAFGLLLILALVLTWLPVSRINAHYQINYNEGWNSYFQNAAGSGTRLYGQSPAHVYANYPPLSFYLAGVLGKVTGDVTLAGRWLSLVSFLALLALSALAVHRLSGSRRAAAFTALLIAIFMGALKPDRIGMNDPHLLGMAFGGLGFYAYVRDSDSPFWLRLSAVSFVAALYTKQTLLAFPLAVAVHLFLANRKRFWGWVAAGAAAGVTLLALVLVFAGSHFFEHLMLPRAYTYSGLLGNIVWYLLFFQTSIVIALVWCFRQRLASPAGLLVPSFALAHVLAFWFCAGGGADLNHLFDPIVALAMIGGLALPYAAMAAERVRHGGALLAILLTLPFCLGILAMLPTHVEEDLNTRRSIPRLEQDFSASVQFLRSQPGPALCETLLLCYEAGKPNEYDLFVMDQAVKSRFVAERDLLKLLDSRHFSVIQLDIPAGDQIDTAERFRASSAFMQRLAADYKVAARTSAFTFFTPK